MGMIPEVKCRRCGETFSSLRSRCPNCGTRRVTQSSRTPDTTPGTVKGTAAYGRAESNTKWQMVFGLILVVAVILAVIVMVSTSLDASDNVQSKVTAPVASSDANVPVIESAPTPTPSPTPTLESIQITYYDNEISTDFTLDKDNPIKLTASPYPLTVTGVTFTWTVSDESKVQLDVSEDTKECTTTLLQGGGNCTLTVSAFGVEKTITIYCKDS